MEPNFLINRPEIDFAQIIELQNLVDDVACFRQWITVSQSEFIDSEGVVHSHTFFSQAANHVYHESLCLPWSDASGSFAFS